MKKKSMKKRKKNIRMTKISDELGENNKNIRKNRGNA